MEGGNAYPQGASRWRYPVVNDSICDPALPAMIRPDWLPSLFDLHQLPSAFAIGLRPTLSGRAQLAVGVTSSRKPYLFLTPRDQRQALVFGHFPGTCDPC